MSRERWPRSRGSHPCPNGDDWEERVFCRGDHRKRVGSKSNIGTEPKSSLYTSGKSIRWNADAAKKRWAQNEVKFTHCQKKPREKQEVKRLSLHDRGHFLERCMSRSPNWVHLLGMLVGE